MGYYIQVPENEGKAQQLVGLHGATILPMRPEAFEDVPEGQALICVVDNGAFEAAALCYSREEFIEFTSPDVTTGHQRPRTWVLMAKALAHELAGYSS
jgi:hypothetical protein